MPFEVIRAVWAANSGSSSIGHAGVSWRYDAGNDRAHGKSPGTSGDASCNRPRTCRDRCGERVLAVHDNEPSRRDLPCNAPDGGAPCACRYRRQRGGGMGSGRDLHALSGSAPWRKGWTSLRCDPEGSSRDPAAKADPTRGSPVVPDRQLQAAPCPELGGRPTDWITVEDGPTCCSIGHGCSSPRTAAARPPAHHLSHVGRALPTPRFTSDESILRSRPTT